jgi:hypothetical protein
MHGWGSAQRLEQSPTNVAPRDNQGHAVPGRLCGWSSGGLIRSRWGFREHRVRGYSLTPGGRRQLVEEKAQWTLVSGVINRLLASEE